MRNFTPILFLSVVLSSMGHPAPSSAEATSFCLPVDSEMLERHLQRPAGKPALLNAGEPRTVRMIYFVSDPQAFRQEVVDKMKSTIREVQRIFADQIRAHGFGERTFRFERDAQNEPMVHIAYGAGDTYDHWGALERIHQEFDFDTNVYFIVLGNEEDIQSRNVLGLGLQNTRTGGWAMLRQYIDPNFVARAAHELGHAFGLWHNFNDGAYIMSYGPGKSRLSELSAGHLAVHPHFNPDSPTETLPESELPTGQVLSSRSYRTGATSVPIQLELSHPDGLQQVSLFVTTPETHFSAGSPELKTGRLLEGVTSAIVDFEYDGIIPSDRDHTNLSTLLTHRMEFEVVDMLGNIGKIGLSLLHNSTHKLVISLDRGKRNGAYGVAFSPDGKVLASGSENQTVELWNAETGEHIATLSGYEGRGYHRRVYSVAFSPDGTILATGTWEGTIKLWDVETRTEIITFEHGGDEGRIMSLAFSPDGKILASALTDDWTSPAHTIKLWDMATKTEIATLSGHINGVQSVSFSPDGKTLASGAFDSTIRLWDVATKTQIAYLPYENTVTSVSFSPDGKTLISGAFNNNLAFWDVDKKTFKDAFEVSKQSILRYVSFTPDGEKVVSAIQGGDIELWGIDWDTNTYESIAAFQGASGEKLFSSSGSFSPDGTTFATALGNYGKGDYTIVLWDMSPYVTPVVHIADFNLKAAIRETLGKSGYGPITRTDIARLTTLNVSNREIRDLTGLESATQLTQLNLEGNPLNPLAVNTHLPALEARGVAVLFSRMAEVLTKLSGDNQEAPSGTQVQDPFVVQVLDQNGVVLPGAVVAFSVTIGEGSLSATAATTDANGRASTTLTLGREPGSNTVEVTVAELEPLTFSAVGIAIPQVLRRVAGLEQEGPAGAQLAEPLVVLVRDQNGEAHPGAVVTFVLLGDGGTLSAFTDTTDAEGRAATTLTLGRQPGTYTVEATVEGLEPVTFTATAEATPDFNGDGLTDFSDFFLFAEAFGGSDPRFDLDGSGSVDFADFFLFAENFGQPARAKLVAMAREVIGLPDGPQLQQNAPNPFNSQTVISWFQLHPGEVRLEVFALTGQRVAVLHEGAEKAGLHRLHWDGRSDQGHPLASGVYVYRLVTGEGAWTRKITLLR